MKLKSNHLQNLGFWLLLLLILGFTLLVRIYRAEWGLPYLYYWDEPQTASTALRILKTGNFNPWFFSYGTLPIYINYVVDVFHYLYLMGQPPTAISYLDTLKDIQVFGDTDWIWSISHPSFYYWNRVTTVAFSTASVWLTFLIASNIFINRWIGLVAALFIASIIPHAEFSALITPDIPMGFFVLATTYLSLKFLDLRKTNYFAASLICAGCAFATKYNSALVILLPSMSLLILYMQDRKHFNFYWLAMLPIVPVVTFFICMPYAAIDSVSFLTGIGFEVRHYKIFGHGPAFTIGAGIRHIKFQAAQILNNIGVVGVVAVGLGLFASIKKPKLLFISIFPLAYFFYMTTTIINFHRNFLIIYPFLAVGYAGATYVLWHSAKWLHGQINSRKTFVDSAPPLSMRYLPILLSALLVTYLVFMAYWALDDAKKVRQVVDSRTALVNQINLLASKDQVLVPAEIRMHEHDLIRLKGKYKVVPLREIFSCAGNDKSDLAIVPAELEPGGRTEEERALVAAYPNWFKRLDINLAKLTVGNQFTSLDRVSINPKLYVFDQHTLAMSMPSCAN